MILAVLLLIMMAGGLIAWIAGKAARWVSFLTLLVAFILVLNIWITGPAVQSGWLLDFNVPWISQIGMSFHLAMDGISLVMTALTLFLGAVSVLLSWKHVTKNVGFFYFNLLWLLAGITGVFLAMDLMLFYFFWEIMLVPMYFVIAIWGHEKRRHAGIKFFLFTQLSGLLMLIAIIGLYFVHASNTGVYTFDYFALLGTKFAGNTGFWLMSGFLIAFLVKLPVFPFHSWLPDAYTEAPAAGSVVIAALMSKTAAYGLLRFVLPLFPDAASQFAFWGILIGVIGILYGAKMAYSQRNLKRLIAFSSFSHMGFIMVGVFSLNSLGYQGVLLQMVAHALSIAALFIIASFIYDRTGNLDMNKMGGFWQQMPNMGGTTLIFVMASLGLPGLANFVAEFLILAGSWQVNIPLAVLATLGLIVSVTYSLRILQQVFQQKINVLDAAVPDLNVREWVIMGSLIVTIIWLGFWPQTVLEAAETHPKPPDEVREKVMPAQNTSTYYKFPEQLSAYKVMSMKPEIILTGKKGGDKW